MRLTAVSQLPSSRMSQAIDTYRLGVHLRLDAGLARLVLGRTSLLLSAWIGGRHVSFPS